MKQEIYEFLEKYNEYHYKDTKWYEPLYDEEDALDFLFEVGDPVAELDRTSHRWWDEFILVKKFTIDNENTYIGYCDAHANRDESIEDLGFTFDKSTIAFYKPKEITKITYVRNN